MPHQGRSESTQETMVRIGPIMGVPAALKSLELDPQEVLAEGDFDIRIFNNPDNLISFSARGQLLAHCAEKTNCRHFGLLVGKHSGLRSLGLVGLLTQHSPDVRTALNNLARYFHLHTPGAVVTLHENNGIATLSYYVREFRSQENAEVGSGAVAIMFNVLQELCGPNWLPREIWFMHQQPHNTRAYRQFFQTHLQFNTEQNAVFFMGSWLNRPLTEAHPDLYKIVKQQIELLDAQQDSNFLDKVREVLHTAILGGYCKADRVAALLSMHPRTLNRRIRAYGIGYRELVDEVTYTIARQLLNETGLGVDQIATNLNYADARSFIRAFRRWSDTTPARWRAQQKLLCSKA